MENQSTPFEIVNQAPADGSNSLLKHEETAEERIKQEIKRFSLPDVKIAEMKKNFGKLKIRPLPAPDAKEELKLYRDEKEKVQKALAVVRSVRTGLEKKRKELKADYIKIGKGIDAEAERLTDLVSPLENQLKEYWDASEKAEDDRKNEAERLAQEKLQGRVHSLLESGIQFDGSFYSIGDVSVDVVTLKTLPDDKFESLLSKVRELKAKKNEEDRLEAERLEGEKRKAEEERLEFQRQQEEFRKQQDELRKQQEELKAAQERQQKAMIQGRRTQIEGLGLVWSSAGQHYIFEIPSARVVVELKEIETASEESFATILQNVATLVKEGKDKEEARIRDEQKEQEKREYRHRQLSNVPLRWDGQNFAYKDINFHWTDVLTMSDSQFENALAGAKTRMDELRAEENQQETEKKRLADRFNTRVLDLLKLGFVMNPSGNQMVFHVQWVPDMAVDVQIIREMEDADWANHVASLTKETLSMMEESKRLIEEEKANQEAERKSRMSEAELILEYFKKLKEHAKPDIQTGKFQDATETFFIELDAITEWFERTVAGEDL